MSKKYVKKGHCITCYHFMGFDGIGELWTSCNLLGDFKGSHKGDCKKWESKNKPKLLLLKSFQRWFNSQGYSCRCMDEPMTIDDEDVETYFNEVIDV